MSDLVNGLYKDTFALIERFGKCIASDPESNPRKDWNVISAAVKSISNDSLELSAAEDVHKQYTKTLERYTECNTGFKCEEMIQKYEDNMEDGLKDLQLGSKSEIYKNLKINMVGKESKKQDESEITAVSQNILLIDPVTKLPLTDPVKNVICGHVYEKKTILQLLASKRQIKCPIPGCVAATDIIEDDLVPDEALKEQLVKNH